jgi:hypothetical protein
LRTVPNPTNAVGGILKIIVLVGSLRVRVLGSFAIQLGIEYDPQPPFNRIAGEGAG